MSDFQSRHAARIADLNNRLTAINEQTRDLDTRRNGLSFDASQGHKTSLKEIAQIDSQLERLLRESKTLSAAIAQAEQLAQDEQKALLDKQEQARHKQAREFAGTVATYNDEIDKLLVQLREALERRMETAHQLSRTDVVDRGLVNRMLGKDALTRALHHHGIHRFAAIMVGAPQSAGPMSQANKLLSGFGGGYIEADKVKRVMLDD